MRGNFIYGRTFVNEATSSSSGSTWLERVANVRLHGTTRERPRVRFDREERFTRSRSRPGLYTSVIVELPATTTPTPRTPRPVIPVEKRSLAAYAQLTGRRNCRILDRR